MRTSPIAPAAKGRQAFFPDGSRSFEEIDRLQIGEHGTGNLISAQAEIDFYRILPPSGYTKGLPADRRTDTGAGRHRARAARRRFLPLQAFAPRRIRRVLGWRGSTNAVQRILASGKYDGAIWTEGSPRIEETIYWLNLLIDTTVPICGNAAQRAARHDQQ